MKRVTLIPGDGVGPEIVEACRRVIEAAGAEVEWELQEAGAEVMDKYGTPLPSHVIDSIRTNKVAMKGPITTPVGSGFRSINVAMRKELDLYANLRPARSIEGVRSPYRDIDLVVVRENTEDLYAGIERQVDEDTAESINTVASRATGSTRSSVLMILTPFTGPSEIHPASGAITHENLLDPPLRSPGLRFGVPQTRIL